MAKYVYEVLSEVTKKTNKTDKIKVLRENDSWALRDIIRGSMDATVKFDLPPGLPPYTASEGHNHPANLLKEHKNFKYFVKGLKSSAALPALKRERIFIGLIESVHPEDAKLVIGMVNKQKPKGLSRPIVEEAFPGLLRDKD